MYKRQTTAFAQGQGKGKVKDKVKSEVKEMKAKHLDKRQVKGKGAVKGGDVQQAPDRPQPRPRGEVKEPRMSDPMPAPKGERAEDSPRVTTGKPTIGGKPTLSGKPTLNANQPRPTGKPGKGLSKGDVKPGKGHGDKNHDHSGKGHGHDKDKVKKGNAYGHEKDKGKDGVRPGHGHGDKNHEHTGPKGKSGADRPTINEDRNIGKGATIGKATLGKGNTTPKIEEATIKGKSSIDKATTVITAAEKEVQVYKGKVKAAKEKVMAELKKNPNSKEAQAKLQRVQQAEAKVNAMESELIQERRAVSNTRRVLSVE